MINATAALLRDEPKPSLFQGARRAVAKLLIGSCVFAAPAFTQAAHAPPPGNGQPEAIAGPTSAAEAEAFFDEVIEDRIREFQGVGAVVSLVRGTETLFAKGYGTADLETGRLVDAERTRFHIASISKLFIWTAAMQLVEDGRLDLHADINRYLTGFQVPEAFDQPITMAHLMTHTAGFDNRVLGLHARGGSELPALAKEVEDLLPPRIMPPGERPAYSNYGSGLAALVVQEVAGEPYEQVLQKRILDPLQMNDTSIAQPQAGRFAEHLAYPYRFGGEMLQKQSTLVPLAPIGAITSSAPDMARFMVAFLEGGAYGGRRILRDETVRQMQSPLITLDPAVNPLVHGFDNFSTRGVRMLGHTGGGSGSANAVLALFPDHGLGLFVAFNSGWENAWATVDAFVRHHFDAPPRPGDPPADFLDRAGSFTGEYRSNTHPLTTFLRVLGLGSSVDVEITENGELLVLGLPLVETAPRVFTSRDGERSLVFIEGEHGEMSHFYIADDPSKAFARVPPSEGRRLHTSILLLSLLAFVGTLVAWPLGWLRRRWRKAEVDSSMRLPWRARSALWTSAVLLLASLVGMATYIPDEMRLLYGEVAPLRVVFALPLIALVPAMVAVGSTFVAWRRNHGTLLGRLGYTGAVAATALFYWFLNTWNLLGFHF